MSEICRLCLQSSAETFEINENYEKPLKLKEKLKLYLPDINLEKVRKSVMCTTCFTQLNAFHVFVLRCRESEKCITSYMDLSCTSQLNEIPYDILIEDKVNIQKTKLWNETIDFFKVKDELDVVMFKDDNDVNFLKKPKLDVEHESELQKLELIDSSNVIFNDVPRIVNFTEESEQNRPTLIKKRSRAKWKSVTPQRRSTRLLSNHQHEESNTFDSSSEIGHSSCNVQSELLTEISKNTTSGEHDVGSTIGDKTSKQPNRKLRQNTGAQCSTTNSSKPKRRKKKTDKDKLESIQKAPVQIRIEPGISLDQKTNDLLSPDLSKHFNWNVDVNREDSSKHKNMQCYVNLNLENFDHFGTTD